MYSKRKYVRVEFIIKVIYFGKKYFKECFVQSYDDVFVQRVVVWVQYCLNGDIVGKYKNQEYSQLGYKVFFYLEIK